MYSKEIAQAIVVKALVVNGYNYQEIAQRLKVPIKVVKEYEQVDLGRDWDIGIYEATQELKPEYDPVKVRDFIRSVKEFDTILKNSSPASVINLYQALKVNDSQ